MRQPHLSVPWDTLILSVVLFVVIPLTGGMLTRSAVTKKHGKDYPVICMDEKPVQFFADFHKGFRSKKDGVQYEDYQYIRNGTASIFLFTEPLAGWRYADVQERRTAQDWAKQIERLLTKQYPMAKKIVLVMDNLNTHNSVDREVTLDGSGSTTGSNVWYALPAARRKAIGLILLYSNQMWDHSISVTTTKKDANPNDAINHIHPNTPCMVAEVLLFATNGLTTFRLFEIGRSPTDTTIIWPLTV